MITYDDEKIDEIIERAAERAEKRLTRVIDKKISKFSDQNAKSINEAAERGAGIYYEKTRHAIDLVLESTDFIKEKLEDMVTRGDFNELKGEVKLIKQAVIDTSRDLHKLENTVYHA